ncbi:MAG: anhydro-N-acetylmuramic acid kinase [Rhodothermales bacterium]|nr:anhydro-N-acetylmuramic acid kinase [Rhodothermales bacterium]
MPLAELLDQRLRTVAGLMSGTSLDGVDCVVAALEGSGRGMGMTVLGTAFLPYDDGLRETLLAQSLVDRSDVRALSGLSFLLADRYADAVHAALDNAGLPLEALDAVGCHGQTVHHVPDPEPVAGVPVASTLQIGNPCVLAKRLGVPVVGDFRAADVALGGQGAPLVPYFDYVRFASNDETRVLLNLGGIANATLLPKGAGPDAVVAFDTGPANMIVDRLVQRYFDRGYDDGGVIGQSAAPDAELLAHLMDDPYLRREPPKSTGRERYDERFVDAMVERFTGGAPPTDAQARTLVATAAAYTAESIWEAYERFLRPFAKADTLLASGGGRRNAAIMEGLRARFARDGVAVSTTDDAGVDGDLKEALLFAVLAHETLNGAPTNLPRVTGASAATVLGVIALP